MPSAAGSQYFPPALRPSSFWFACSVAGAARITGRTPFLTASKPVISRRYNLHQPLHPPYCTQHVVNSCPSFLHWAYRYGMKTVCSPDLSLQHLMLQQVESLLQVDAKQSQNRFIPCGKPNACAHPSVKYCLHVPNQMLNNVKMYPTCYEIVV